MRGVTSGPDGRLWFTLHDSGAIGAITTGGVVTLYRLPNGDAEPLNIIDGPDGRLWFTEANAGAIGAITTTGVISEYPLPDPTSGPTGISTGPDGELWFSETDAGSIGAMTTSGQLTQYPLPTQDQNPVGIAYGADGRLWFTDPNVDQVSALDPATGDVRDYGFPGGQLLFDEEPQYLAMAPNGELWATEAGGTSLAEVGGVTTGVSPSVTGVNPISGPTGGGTSVTITGSNLTGTTAVAFGGHPALSFAVVDAAHISAVDPPGTAGEVDVTVTTPAGTTAASPADRFYYGAGPAPQPIVTGVSPPTGSTTGGDHVAITGSGLTDGTVTFGSAAATGVTCTDTQCNVTTPPGSLGTVDITVSGTGGTSAVTTADQFTYLNPPPPPPTITDVSPSSGNVAGGTDVTLTGTNLSDGLVTFGLHQATATCNDTACSVTAPPSGVGAVDVRVTNAGGISATSPADVFAYSGAGLSIPTNSLPGGAVGIAYDATVTASGGQSPYRSWMVATSSPGPLPPGLSINASTGAITGTPTAVGIYTFTVSVTDSEPTPVTAVSGSLSITIAPVPTVSAYTAVTPYRVCDTRGTDGLSGTDAQCAGQKLSAGGTLTIDVSGTNPTGSSTGGVPASGATAVVLNVTATGEASQGFITVWPAGGTRPAASSLNYKPNKTVPNLVTIGLPASGQVSLYSLQATNLVVDVEGYYAAPTGTAGLFNSVTPYRICDTRGADGLMGANAQCAGHTLSGGQTLTFNVTGTNPSGTSSGGLPSTGVSAVVLNVTAIGHSAGYVTAFPQGVAVPTASNLNFSSGQVVPNRVIVPVSGSGQVSLTTNGSVDVVVDVNGWFTDGTSPSQTGAFFVAAPSPSRICDTRSNGNSTPCVGETITSRTPLLVPVAGHGPVPSSAVVAVVANITAVDTTSQSYLTAWPTGATQPTASDLNWVAGLTVPNMSVVGLGTGGDISVYVAAGNADVIIDVAGWYVN